MKHAQHTRDEEDAPTRPSLNRGGRDEGAVRARRGGLDIHKRIVVESVIVSGTGGQPTKEVRSFGTMTDDILRLADLLGP
jgi:hypothetical protein